MTPYWILFFFVAVAALFPWRLAPAQARLVWLLFGASVAIMIGFRHEVGGDWFNYARQFDWVSDMSFTESVTTTKDPGYYPLGWIIAHLGGSIYWLNLACASLLVAGTLRLAKLQRQPWLALLAAVPYLLVVVGMGYTRQSAAIGCAMLGLVALADGRLRHFAVWVLIGAAFHKSAVMLLPIAAIAATTNRLWTMAWVSVASALAYWAFVAESSEALISNYVLSDYADASQGAGVRVAMNVVPAVVFLMFRRHFCATQREHRLWTVLAIGAISCIALLPVSATATDRIALYFIPLQIFVFGRITQLGRTRLLKTTFALGVVAYYSVVLFVWLNFASHADSWIPYQIAEMNWLF